MCGSDARLNLDAFVWQGALIKQSSHNSRSMFAASIENGGKVRPVAPSVWRGFNSRFGSLMRAFAKIVTSRIRCIRENTGDQSSAASKCFSTRASSTQENGQQQVYMFLSVSSIKSLPNNQTSISYSASTFTLQFLTANLTSQIRQTKCTPRPSSWLSSLA